jgi:hypothetical protein
VHGRAARKDVLRYVSEASLSARKRLILAKIGFVYYIHFRWRTL